MSSQHSDSTPPQVLLDQNFYDMSLLGEAVEWELDFRQIEAGRLNARAALLAGTRNMFMRVEFDRKFHQRGCPPPGILSFGFPDHSAGPLRWNGREAMPGALLNFNGGRFEGVNPGNFGGYTLSFTEDLLYEVARILGVDVEISSICHSVAFWNPQNNEHHFLRRNLQKIEHASRTPGNPGLDNLAELFNFDLAASLVRILAQDSMQVSRETAPFRAAALKRALAFIEDRYQSPVRIRDMCKAVGASWATLERAFAEEFGVTPKSYIQSKRLAAVRRQLIRSEPGTLIADVANHWGFWHMGRLAADYSRQFGELPSETLGRGHFTPDPLLS